MNNQSLSVVMLGATGAVGSHVARILATIQRTERLALLGRRSLSDISSDSYRGIPVDQLGRTTAVNLLRDSSGLEMLSWDDFIELTNT